MRKELFSYEQLCDKYGKEIIDPLESYEYWQLQTTGVVMFQNKPYDLIEWLEITKKKAAPFAGYDYEDDAFTFAQWMQHQAEVEYNTVCEME
jgi:hypothetical protein